MGAQFVPLYRSWNQGAEVRVEWNAGRRESDYLRDLLGSNGESMARVTQWEGMWMRRGL